MALSVTIPVSHGETQSVQQLSKAAVAARVDSMARAYMAEKGPASMSVAITRGDDTLVMKAWGLADLDANRPATAANTYQIGSISKQFTAVLLLKQVERGKLALTDSIGAYLTTGLRPEWRPLTIEQLLNHTSGVKSYTGIPGYTSLPAAPASPITPTFTGTILFPASLKQPLTFHLRIYRIRKTSLRVVIIYHSTTANPN